MSSVLIMSKAISDIPFDFKASHLVLEPTFYMCFLHIISPSTFIKVNPEGPESVFLKLRSGYDWIDRLVFRSLLSLAFAGFGSRLYLSVFLFVIHRLPLRRFTLDDSESLKMYKLTE